jgi:hypothetical protein
MKASGEMGWVYGCGQPDKNVIADHDCQNDIPAAELVGFRQRQRNRHNDNARVSLSRPVPIVQIRAVTIGCIQEGRIGSR